MVGSTPTIIDSFLKDNYTKESVPKLVNEDHVFLDMLDTQERGTGRQLIVPIIDSNAQGLGATVADAQVGAEQTSGGTYQGADWNIAWGDYSAHVNIGDKAMAVSASDMGAFFRDKQEEVDSLYRAWGDTFSSYALRDQGHSLGSGTNSSGVQTLTNKQDIVNFEVGQIIVPSANDGTSTSHTLIASAGLGYVVAVNYNTGTFSVSATSGGSAGTPANWTGTMYYFRSGDFGGDVAPNRIILGYGAWNPAADPTSTTFEGVNRAINIVRRSGIRLVASDLTGLGVEKRIKRLCTVMASRAKKPTKVLLHPEQWEALSNSLEARGQRPLEGKVGIFSFQKIQLATPGGMVDVFADKFMPVTAAYAFDPKAIRLLSVDGFPKVVNADGFQMIRRATSNVYEFRLAGYPAYYHYDCTKTGRATLLAP
jgi:hypothetical protein